MELFIVFAALVTLGILARRLPLQNICAIAFLTIGLSLAVEVLSVTTGFPIVHSICSIFPPANMAWPVPLLWLVFLLNLRNLAKWILRSRRTRRFYGSEMLLMTSGFTAIIYAVLPFFFERKIAWQNIPGVGLAAVLILLCLTPWLIEKKPQSHRAE